MGKSLSYTEEIQESSTTLSKLLRKEKDTKNRERLRFLLLLKSGKVKSQSAAGMMINIGERQSQNLWRKYRTGGLEALLLKPQRGRQSKLNEEQIADLEERLKQDDIQFLDEASELIKKEYGESYTRSGVFRLFQRMKVKKKTGRPVNIRQDKAGLANFKKTIRS